MLSISSFHKYISSYICYSGDVIHQEAVDSCNSFKQENKNIFSDYIQTPFNITLSQNPKIEYKNKIANELLNRSQGSQVGGIINCGGISSMLDAIMDKWDRLYAKRVYVYAYVNEGLDEMEFAEARENVAMLTKDLEDSMIYPNEGEEENE
mmetsp:Transcript_11913/g.10525  ORF Transcript_11913/g.10525 Transcript_11913/m.10525 type:complete len:151 (+) Transcript_11913:915-1367(+)